MFSIDVLAFHLTRFEGEVAKRSIFFDFASASSSISFALNAHLIQSSIVVATWRLPLLP